MVCMKCGKEVDKDAVFCTSCGEKINKQDIAENSITKKSKKVGAKKKGKRGFVVVLLLLACVVIVAVTVMCMKGKGLTAKYEIDLGKYASIEFEGYSGIGTASWNFNKRDFFDDYEDKLKFPPKFEEKAEELGDDILSIVEYCCESTDIDMEEPDDEDAVEFIYFFLFDSMGLKDMSGLTNGEEVGLFWRFEKKWSEEQKTKVCELFGVSVNYDNMNYVVNGLTEVPQFDPFEGVEISYSGAAPAGKAILANYPDNGWTYQLIAPETVTNGDEIQVRLVIEQYDMDYYIQEMEEYIETYGMVPSSTEKTYIVSGLPEYITSASQIPAETLAELQAQAEDIIKGTTYNWIRGYTLDISYIGNYVLSAKEVESMPQDMVTLVYKMHYTNSFVDYLTKNAQEFTTDYYFYVTWENLMFKEDGTLVYDKNAYVKPKRQFKVVTQIYEGYSYYHDFYLTGYATLDEVYNECVIQYIEKYKLEENIIK